MSNFQHYQPSQYQPQSGDGGKGNQHPQKSGGSLKKGLGFFPSSIHRTMDDPIASLLQVKTKSISPFPTGEHGSSIPLIDMGCFLKEKKKSQKKLVEAIGLGLTKVGCVAIKVDGIAPSKRQVLDVMKQYFHQPLEKKILDWQKNAHQLGGYSPSCENTCSFHREIDVRETFFVPQQFRSWPGRFLTFERVISQHHACLRQYAFFSMNCLLEYLGHSSTEIEPVLQAGETTLHLTYNPIISAKSPPETCWMAPHIDPHALIVMSPGTTPGLQILNGQGSWSHVTVPENFLILAVGQQIERKTDGFIKARKQRIISPGGCYAHLERFSTELAFSWKDDFLQTPFAQRVRASY